MCVTPFLALGDARALELDRLGGEALEQTDRHVPAARGLRGPAHRGVEVGEVGVGGEPIGAPGGAVVSGTTRTVSISRAVPNIRSNRPAETRDFFVELLGFEVAMDLGWITTVASPANRSVQVSIVGNDDMAAPGISVGVDDVDAVHARAVEQGFEIAYPLRDEEWGVRRFMLREPSGTLVNVVSHRPG